MTRYLLHKDVLVSKIIREDLRHFLDTTVNLVGFTKRRSLQSRMLANFLENLAKSPRDLSPTC